MWNEVIDIAESGFISTINFVSNNESFTELQVGTNFREILWYEGTLVYSRGAWSNESYRTITFETEPTGLLLEFLNLYAVKQ